MAKLKLYGGRSLREEYLADEVTHQRFENLTVRKT